MLWTVTIDFETAGEAITLEPFGALLDALDQFGAAGSLEPTAMSVTLSISAVTAGDAAAMAGAIVRETAVDVGLPTIVCVEVHAVRVNEGEGDDAEPD